MSKAFLILICFACCASIHVASAQNDTNNTAYYTYLQNLGVCLSNIQTQEPHLNQEKQAEHTLAECVFKEYPKLNASVVNKFAVNLTHTADAFVTKGLKKIEKTLGQVLNRNTSRCVNQFNKQLVVVKNPQLSTTLTTEEQTQLGTCFQKHHRPAPLNNATLNEIVDRLEDLLEIELDRTIDILQNFFVANQAIIESS